MSVKYVVCPGYSNPVKNKNLIISARKLMKLYGVKTYECVILNRSDPKYEHKYVKYASEGYIFLFPRNDGNYSQALKFERKLD